MPESFENASRRRFLRRSGAALATGLTALGAGCSGLPPLGTRVRYGSVDAPAAADPAYREWLPAPSALPDLGYGRPENYHVGVYAPEAASGAPEHTSIARGLITHSVAYAGLHLDDADLAFAGRSVGVLLGDVDPATVREVLADTGYEPDGTYADYELFARADVPRVLGVRDGAVVCAGGDRAHAEFRAFADARAGDGPRYVDRDADFDALSESGGLRQWGLLHPGSDGAWSGHSSVSENDATADEDPVGWGIAFDADDSGVYHVETFVFSAGADVTEARMKRRLDEQGRVADSSTVDVEIDGRVATVEMYFTHEQYRMAVSNDPLVTPHVTWGVTYDADAERLTFHHEAGDPVRTGWLTAYRTGREPATSFDGVGDAVRPGDEVTVSTTDVRADASVRLAYEAPDRSASTTLIAYQLP
ncbi:hypothetical protein SAMN05216559_4041 [Halomicrobium zhouii]|uniref:Uncharacterized protein n=1 Tax=Halomicrobium zhouii TaxID=767519 RepID=A0A1I6M9B7_9EURY|nr:hypothetical protein [Halomicrobium zhouii]SFS12213.1 hypothetical protein SAMN05216559_4041 [Halomicrobium zhouii]